MILEEGFYKIKPLAAAYNIISYIINYDVINSIISVKIL